MLDEPLRRYLDQLFYQNKTDQSYKIKVKNKHLDKKKQFINYKKFDLIIIH